MSYRREQVIKKIKLLRRKQNDSGTTESEKLACAAKILSLLKKYNLKAEETEDHEPHHATIDFDKPEGVWVFELAAGIGAFVGVEHTYSSVMPDFPVAARVTSIKFSDHDWARVQAAEALFSLLYDMFKKRLEARIAHNTISNFVINFEYKINPNRVRHSFGCGFAVAVLDLFNATLHDKHDFSDHASDDYDQSEVITQLAPEPLLPQRYADAALPRDKSLIVVANVLVLTNEPTTEHYKHEEVQDMDLSLTALRIGQAEGYKCRLDITEFAQKRGLHSE